MTDYDPEKIIAELTSRLAEVERERDLAHQECNVLKAERVNHLSYIKRLENHAIPVSIEQLTSSIDALKKEVEDLRELVKGLEGNLEACEHELEALDNSNHELKQDRDSIVEIAQHAYEYASHGPSCRSQRSTTSHMLDPMSSWCDCGFRELSIKVQTLAQRILNETKNGGDAK